MAELQISIVESTDDVAELRDLWSAILGSEDLRLVRKSFVPDRPVAGNMGAAEVVRLVLERPEFYPAVAAIVTAWLATRRSKLKVVFLADGAREIEFDGVRPTAAATVVEALTAACEGRDDEAAGR
ncbi:hypothetical protein AB0H58_29590 [Nocardia neocaledoniensis]|uniref:effector-associated constant component EACC1 n=1 Tax=Nocardia neocaledoniensis TaxID=236511 RepID=UPI0033CA23CE